ncbi:exonuclease II Exo2, partial [Coemansia erecta]
MPSLKGRGGPAGELQLVRGLVADSVCRARMRPGFPSLFTAPHTARLAFNGTEVFGAPSRDETVVLDVQPNSLAMAGSTAEIAQNLLGGKQAHGSYRPRRLFVAWPYLKDAVLVGVSDEAGVYTIDGSGSHIVQVPYRDGSERQVWTKLYTDAIYKSKREHGVVLPEGRRVLLHVLLLRGLQLYPDGSLVRDYGFDGRRGNPTQPWADVSAWADMGVCGFPPGQVLTDLSGSWVNNPRFAEHEAIPLDKAFPASSRVFFLGRTPLYGAPGKVIGHTCDANGTVVGVDMQLQACVNPAASKHENFLGTNALTHYARTGRVAYKPAYAVARQVGISTLLLSRITSRMLVLDEAKARGGDAVRIQIGLDLKFEAKRLKVAGYSRRAPNGWQFSQRAIDLIARYRAAFPDMFMRLESACKRDSILTAAECFVLPPSADADTAKSYVASEVKRLKQWMKDNVDRSSLALVPIESELLTGDQVSAIIEAVATSAPAAKKHVIVRGVRREAVLRPSDAQYLLKAQSLTVGHRVEYVSDRSGSVPLGARGYI